MSDNGEAPVLISGRGLTPSIVVGVTPMRLDARAHALHAAIAEVGAVTGGSSLSLDEQARVQSRVVLRAGALEAWLLRPVDVAAPAPITGGLPDVQD